MSLVVIEYDTESFGRVLLAIPPEYIDITIEPEESPEFDCS